MRGTADMSRRSPLLLALAGFCLVVLAGLPSAASRHVAVGAGDAVVAAIGDVAVAARTAPDRLAPAHRPGSERNLPPSAALAVAGLLALVLFARGRRNTLVSTTPRPLLLRAAGRGPPATS